MSDEERSRYWNPAGIGIAAVFLSVGLLFAAVAAAAAGWIRPPAGAPEDIGFGPFGAGVVAIVFLYVVSRCNLWVVVERDAVRVRGVFRSIKVPRTGKLTATHDLRTRPTGLRLTADHRSVLVYPRPRRSDALIRTLTGR